MPYFAHGNAQLYWDEVGSGAPIVTTHGLSETGAYWSLPGVSARLAEAGYRVIDMDMRAHGRTLVHREPHGFDVETMARDIDALANHLGLSRFHLLTHATGGMVGLRYAMRYGDRLLSLMSTDTGSATAPSDGACHAPADHVFKKIDPSANPLAKAWERFSVRQLLEAARAGDGEPFMNRLNANPDPERCWRTVEAVLAGGNPATYVEFMRSFYDDPNPMVAELRKIPCPNLVLLGEFDTMFIEPSRLLAREIPDAKHVVLDGLGHMTAIEDPARTSEALIAFLDGCAR